MLEFSIRNSSLISEVESRKLVGALINCFVLFGTLQQCAPTKSGGNRTWNLKVRKQVSNRFRLGISTSPINDIARITSPPIASYVILTYSGHGWSRNSSSNPTRLHWCKLLKSSKPNETAVQCSKQLWSFGFTACLVFMAVGYFHAGTDANGKTVPSTLNVDPHKP